MPFLISFCIIQPVDFKADAVNFGNSFAAHSNQGDAESVISTCTGT
jgi:hypothetical protein